MRRPRWLRTPRAVSTACQRIDDSTMLTSVRAAAPSSHHGVPARHSGTSSSASKSGALPTRTPSMSADAADAQERGGATCQRRRRLPSCSTVVLDHARAPFPVRSAGSGESTAGGPMDGSDSATDRGTRRHARHGGPGRLRRHRALHALGRPHLPVLRRRREAVDAAGAASSTSATSRRPPSRPRPWPSSPAGRASPCSPPGRASPTAISAVTTAHFNGSPLVVLGGRAPQARWGAGSLQEFDHVPVLAPITKLAATATAIERVRHRWSHERGRRRR